MLGLNPAMTGQCYLKQYIRVKFSDGLKAVLQKLRPA